MIAALTSSFLTGIENNPTVPDKLASDARMQLASGVPFISDADLQKALVDAGVSQKTADAAVTENADARLPTTQPAATPAPT